MATTLATSTTTHQPILTEICELEELKKNTGVTNSILATARNRLANDDSQKVVKLLIDKLQKSYSDMLDSVERCKLVVLTWRAQELRTCSASSSLFNKVPLSSKIKMKTCSDQMVNQ